MKLSELYLYDEFEEISDRIDNNSISKEELKEYINNLLKKIIKDRDNTRLLQSHYNKLIENIESSIGIKLIKPVEISEYSQTNCAIKTYPYLRTYTYYIDNINKKLIPYSGPEFKPLSYEEYQNTRGLDIITSMDKLTYNDYLNIKKCTDL